MPTATISPAMPGRVRVKPAALREQQHHGVGDGRRHEQRRDHDEAEAAVVEEAVDHHREQTDQAREDAGRELVTGERGTDGLDRGVLLERDRQGAVAQAGGQALGGRLVEVAADLRLAVGMMPSIVGAEMTSPSRTIANCFWVPYSALEISANLSVPSPLKSSETTQLTSFCGMPARGVVEVGALDHRDATAGTSCPGRHR